MVIQYYWNSEENCKNTWQSKNFLSCVNMTKYATSICASQLSKSDFINITCPVVVVNITLKYIQGDTSNVPERKGKENLKLCL